MSFCHSGRSLSSSLCCALIRTGGRRLNRDHSGFVLLLWWNKDTKWRPLASTWAWLRRLKGPVHTHTRTQSLDSILLIPVRLHLVIRSVCLCVSDIMSVRLLLVEHRTRLRPWFRTRWLLLQVSGPPSARSVSFWVGSSQTPRTSGSASTSTTAVLTERKGGSPEQPPRPGPAWLSCTWIEVHTPSIVTVNDQNHSTLLIPEESMWSQLLQDSRNSNWLIWITNDDSE